MEDIPDEKPLTLAEIIKDQYDFILNQERRVFEKKILDLLLENQGLKKQVQSSQEKADAAKKKMDETIKLRENEMRCWNEQESMLNKIIGHLEPLEGAIVQVRNEKKELQLKLEATEFNYKEMLEETKQKHKEDLSKVRKEVEAEKDKLQKKEEEFQHDIKELKEKAKKDTDEIKKDLEQKLEEQKTQKSTLSKRIRALEKQRIELDETFQKEKLALSDHAAEKEKAIRDLEQIVEKQKIEVKTLRSKDLQGTVAKLRSRNSELIATIKNKNMELSAQNNNIKDLLKDIEDLKSKLGLTNVSLDIAQEEIKKKEEQEEEYCEEKEAMQNKYATLNTQYSKLLVELGSAKAHMHASVNETEKLKIKLERHNNKTLNLQKDLHECIEVLGQPTVFSVKFRDLVHRHMTDKDLSKYIHADQWYQSKSKKVQGMVDRAHAHHVQERQRMQEAIENVAFTYYSGAQLRGMNQAILREDGLLQKIKDLEEEIMKKEKMYEKAMNPSHLKLFSWWRKNVLRNSAFPQRHLVEEADPSPPSAEQERPPSAAQSGEVPDVEIMKHEEPQPQDDSQIFPSPATSPPLDIPYLNNFFAESEDGLPRVD
ncbi:uncharacterized protein ACNS7B_012592 [Menidia menidia]